MANSYTITRTNGLSPIAIIGGATNGNVTGAAAHDTDLLLYGRGSFNWGQGIEQNLIRLTENWADVAQTTTATVNNQYPKQYSGAPNKGIVKPIIGQTWYNKSNNRLYFNVDGQNIAGSWNAVGEGDFVSLSPALQSFQAINSDLKIKGSSPDLYIHNTQTEYGGNSHLLFEANTGGDVTTVTASIHMDQAASDALYIRKFLTRTYDNLGVESGYTTTPLLESDNSLNGYTNQMKMNDFETRFYQPVKAPFVANLADANAMSNEWLATKRVVNFLVDQGVNNVAGDYVNAAGDTMTGDLIMNGGAGLVINAHASHKIQAGFTAQTTQGEGFINLIGHNASFRARTVSNTLNGQPSYILDIEGSTKGRYHARRDAWDSDVMGEYTLTTGDLTPDGSTLVTAGTGDPKLVNPRNGMAESATNPYGRTSGEDIVAVIKYQSYTDLETHNINGGFYIFDDWIEVVKHTGSGKGGIRTQNPNMSYTGGDPDYERTLTTIKAVKDYVASAVTGGTGNFYTNGDNLTIDTANNPTLTLDAADTANLILEAATGAYLILKGESDSKIQLRSASGSAEYGELTFWASTATAAGSLRGRIALDSGSNANTDTLLLQKWRDNTAPNTTNAILQNSLEIRYDSTFSQRPLGVGYDQEHGKLIIHAKDDVFIADQENKQPSWPLFNETLANGILFKNGSGDVIAGITSDNMYTLLFQPPWPSSPNNSDPKPSLTLSEDALTLNNIEPRISGNFLVDQLDDEIDAASYYIATERMLRVRTNRLFQLIGMDQGTRDNESGIWHTGERTGTGSINSAFYIGAYKQPITFDFTDSTPAWFTKNYGGVNPYRAKITFSIPYFLQSDGNTHTQTVFSEKFAIYWEAGPNLTTPSNIQQGNFSAHESELDFMVNPRADNYGTLSGTVLIPMSAGDKVQVRLKEFGGGNIGTNGYHDRSYVGNSVWTGCIV